MSHTTPPNQVERLSSVLARTGLSRSSLYRALANGDFPQPLKISARSIGFLIAEVDAWIAARATSRAAAPHR